MTVKAKNTADEVKKSYEDVMTVSKKSVETATKSYDDVLTFNRETLEALMQAGSVAAKGVEEINAELLTFNKVAFEDGVEAAKAVMSAKTVQEAVDLQTEWVKASFDGYLAQATKVGELAAKATQSMFEPVNARVAAFVEKAAKPVSL